MFLIVGLGNPGREYMDTRHNVGFMALDALSREYGLPFQTKSRFNSQLALGENNSESVVLCKPETYMNLSGETVQSVSAYYKISLDKTIVIHDDIDLRFGKIGYKNGGGAGGHNGLKSIDKHLGPNYHRIRIGIGRPEDPAYEISNFVLGKFSQEEELVILKNIDLITSKMQLLILGDVEAFKRAISV